jgi:AbrB family looped-hinge helix DNA binding protein
MRTTIDAAGRLVIPKSIRRALRLAGGEELEVREAEGRIEITLPARDAELAEDRHGLLSAAGELPPLDPEEVREALERTRR